MYKYDRTAIIGKNAEVLSNTMNCMDYKSMKRAGNVTIMSSYWTPITATVGLFVDYTVSHKNVPLCFWL